MTPFHGKSPQSELFNNLIRVLKCVITLKLGPTETHVVVSYLPSNWLRIFWGVHSWYWMANFGQRGADSDGGYKWPETPLICDTGLEIENDITWGVYIGEKSEKKKSVYNKKWYTNSTKNIFSFDLRSKAGSGEHWRDHATLGDRGYVFYEESPHSCKSYLNIEPVQWQAFLLLIFH